MDAGGPRGRGALPRSRELRGGDCTRRRPRRRDRSTCGGVTSTQAPSPPSAWPRKAEPVLLRQPPGPAVASLGLSMLRPCLPFPPSAWLAEGRASASCASRPALAVAVLGSSTLRPCRRHPFRRLPDFVFRVCAIGNGLHAALALQWIACCSYPKSPNRRGSPSGAETSGGPRHSLVTPGQGVSRVTFG